MPGLTVDPDRLRSDVAAHYDDLDRFYREIWGEHVHHGLWTDPRSTPEEATRRLIDLVAGQARIRAGRRRLRRGLRLRRHGAGAGPRARGARHGADDLEGAARLRPGRRPRAPTTPPTCSATGSTTAWTPARSTP